MPTIVQDIIGPAIASSVANDLGQSELANNPDELVAVISRRVRQVYTLAAMPKSHGGMGKGYYFATSELIVIGASPSVLSEAAFRHSVVRDPAGTRVAVVSQADLDDVRAEMPPAVVIEGAKLRTAGRPHDPVIGESVRVRYTPLPAVLTATSHYIGATIAADPSSTVWPGGVGDPYLVAWLARYLGIKGGDRDPQELEEIKTDLQAAADLFAAVVGVDAARLVADVEDT